MSADRRPSITLRVLGGSIAVLGVATAVVPQYTKCLGDGMAECWNTASVELWFGVALVVIGVALALVGGRLLRRLLAAGSGVVSALIVATPFSIAATCGMAEMTCNVLMKPSLIAIGSLAVVLSVAAFVVALLSKGAEVRATSSASSAASDGASA